MSSIHKGFCPIHKEAFTYTCGKCERDMAEAFGVNQKKETTHGQK